MRTCENSYTIVHIEKLCKKNTSLFPFFISVFLGGGGALEFDLGYQNPIWGTNRSFGAERYASCFKKKKLYIGMISLRSSEKWSSYWGSPSKNVGIQIFFCYWKWDQPQQWTLNEWIVDGMMIECQNLQPHCFIKPTWYPDTSIMINGRIEDDWSDLFGNSIQTTNTGN